MGDDTAQELKVAEAVKLHLSGSVAIPSTFPEVGTIVFLPKGIKYPRSQKSAGVICITQSQGPHSSVTRHVMAADVSAIFVPNDADDIDFRKGKWLLGPDVKEINSFDQKDAPEDGMAGIVYVLEHARVATRVESGMTAAESAQHRAPMTARGLFGCDPRPGCDP